MRSSPASPFCSPAVTTEPASAPRPWRELDDPERLQHPQRLAHGGAADVQLAGELALGREPVAGPDAAVGDRLLDLDDHVLERAAAGDGSEGAVGDKRHDLSMVRPYHPAKLARGAA